MSMARTTLSVILLLLGVMASHAQSVAEFYRGRTVNLLIGVGVGGEYDLQARLVARHIGRHIPGNPAVVPQNMTGAGGIKMANYLFTQAPRDGTSIGMLGNNFPATQAVGGPGVQFDVNRFRWLGTIAPVVETMAVWHTAGVKTIDDLRRREVIAGASGKGAITFIYPSLMNELLGTRFKIVTGYAGGNEINLAMERGEVAARNNTWSSWKATKASWLAERKIIVLAQAGPRAADLDAPSIEELARTPEERRVIELVVSGTRLGRPLATTPDVPEERLAALRAAFRATMADPAFRAEAASMNFEVAPVAGEDMQRTVAEVMSTPRELTARAKLLLE
jgi:tripartite-type tricarboxylate transporter receptor subunit TctC